MEMKVKFNGEDYIAKYNKQSGYYEIELTTPNDAGGIYQADITFTDLLGERYNESQIVQVLAKQNKIKIETNKVFMWIFDYKDFTVKDIVEIADYDINIDEETNSNTIIKVLKETTAKARDIIFIKKNNTLIYLGITKEILNENGKQLYEYTLNYITNLFNQDIILEDEYLIKTTGVEDFIANAITKNFISNSDTFVNINYLRIEVKTHTKKQVSVTNVENGIYNLHTWMTNCTQNYDIVYSFSIVDKCLVMTIENKSVDKQLVDTQAQAISNYTEVFETDVVSKVVVLYSKVNGNDQKRNISVVLIE